MNTENSMLEELNAAVIAVKDSDYFEVGQTLDDYLYEWAERDSEIKIIYGWRAQKIDGGYKVSYEYDKQDTDYKNGYLSVEFEYLNDKITMQESEGLTDRAISVVKNSKPEDSDLPLEDYLKKEIIKRTGMEYFIGWHSRRIDDERTLYLTEFRYRRDEKTTSEHFAVYYQVDVMTDEIVVVSNDSELYDYYKDEEYIQ